MSGSGGNGNSGDISSGGLSSSGNTSGGFGSIDDCSSLFIPTTLNSPKRDVIAKIEVGNILSVQLNREGTIVFAWWENEIAGSITAANLTRLINCLQSGAIFVAEVTRKNGGSCDVIVRPGAQ
jgi:hypothetical protein